MPDLPGTASLRRIAAFGLGGSTADGNGRLSVDTDSWPSLLTPLEGQRLTGLALAAAEAGHLELTPEQLEELLERHRRAMMQALALERCLMIVNDAFLDRGIENVVLKGPALAHTFYPEPSWRPFSDLDLLVRGRDWRRACGVLEEMGYKRDLPEPRPGFDERFGKAASHTAPNGLSLDLHRTLVVGPFGLWLDPEELFRTTVPFSVGGRVMRRLNDSGLLIHACMHASLGWASPLLLTVRDVAQVALQADVDWASFEDFARRWRLRAVVRHAFDTARSMLKIDPPAKARLLIGEEPTRREQRALRAYTTERRFRGGTAVSTMRAIPGVRAKAAYIRGLLLPSREFLEARSGGGPASYFRRWAVPLRWVRRRRSLNRSSRAGLRRSRPRG